VTRLSDYEGRDIRLSEERLEHIERPPEMVSQLDRIKDTLEYPDEVRRSELDEALHLYHRRYETTPVTEKILLVVQPHIDPPGHKSGSRMSEMLFCNAENSYVRDKREPEGRREGPPSVPWRRRR
jgi:hypothetical protein